MFDLVGPIFVFAVAALFLPRAQRGLLFWEKRLLRWSFAAHFFGAVAVYVITKYYYGYGDMIGYHRHGEFLAAHIWNDPAGTLPKVIALFLQMGGEDISLGAPNATRTMHATAGFFAAVFGSSLISICAAVSAMTFFSKLAIYSVLRRHVSSAYHKPVLIAAMLVPSVVFWSGGLMKEAMAMVFLGLVFAGGQRILDRQRLAGGVMLVAGVWGVSLYKAYLLVPFALATVSFVYVRGTRRSLFGNPIRVVGLVVAAFALLVGIGSLFPRYDFRQLQDQLEEEQQHFERVEGGSDIQPRRATGSAAGLAVAAPYAIFTALLRPLIIEARNPIALVNGIETFILFLLLVRALRRSGFSGSVQRIRSSPILVFCLVFTLVLGLGVGFATSNLGTLSRYRMPLVPFFVVLLAVLGDFGGARNRARGKLAKAV